MVKYLLKWSEILFDGSFLHSCRSILVLLQHDIFIHIYYFFKNSMAWKQEWIFRKYLTQLCLENEHNSLEVILIICISREDLVKLWRPKQLIVLSLLNDLVSIFSKNLATKVLNLTKNLVKILVQGYKNAPSKGF